MPSGCKDVWGYVDALTGKEYALVGCNGLVVVDVTIPESPFIVAYDTTTPSFDLKTWQNYVYLVTGGAGTGYIYNIANPANPVFVGTFPSAHNITIDSSGFMYASYPGVTIYDLNPDPTSPDSIWNDGTGGGHDVSIINGKMYDFHGWNQTTNIYDVSNPASPAFLGQVYDTNITYSHQGWVSKDEKYLFICDELSVAPSADITAWDISNPASPFKVGSFSDNSATAHNMFVIGNYSYVAYYTAGVRALDVSDPTNITIADEYDTSPSSGEGFQGAFGIYPYGLNNKLFVSDRDSNLFIFRFTDTLSVTTSHDYTQSVLINLYPNPSSDIVYIEMNTEKLVAMNVYDVTGKSVKQGMFKANGYFRKKLDFSEFPGGMYIVQIVVNNEVFNRKLVIKPKNKL